MKVKKNCHVRISYKMSLANGDLVDASADGDDLEFVCGRGQVVIRLDDHCRYIPPLVGRSKLRLLPYALPPQHPLLSLPKLQP